MNEALREAASKAARKFMREEGFSGGFAHEGLVDAILTALQAASPEEGWKEQLSARVPAYLGNTPTREVLAVAAGMLDEMAERLGGLKDTPVIAEKLRALRLALADPRPAPPTPTPPETGQ